MQREKRFFTVNFIKVEYVYFLLPLLVSHQCSGLSVELKHCKHSISRNVMTAFLIAEAISLTKETYP